VFFQDWLRQVYRTDILQGWGDDCPTQLKEWLKQGTDETMRVSLGPGGSFFAWDSKRIIWDKIPSGLQSSILEWLSPSGWSSGPPRIVTLGARDSYFAMSEYGASSWSIDPKLKANASFLDMKAKVAKGEMAYQDLEVSRIPCPCIRTVVS
jgi:hypothetical protein